MKLAAIDIGSNAARLLITEVEVDTKGNESFNKLNLVRNDASNDESIQTFIKCL